MAPASRTSQTTRFHTVADFVRERLGSSRHEERVASLAGRIFRLTRCWHGLVGEAGIEAAEVLAFAALLHDVGRMSDDARHPQIGARLVLGSRLLPFSARERRLVAYLTRYHRGAVPAEGHDEILRKGEWELAIILLALLRAADALDSRAHGPATVTMSRDNKRLTLLVRPHNPAPKSHKAVSRRKKYRLIESLFGCEVRIKLG